MSRYLIPARPPERGWLLANGSIVKQGDRSFWPDAVCAVRIRWKVPKAQPYQMVLLALLWGTERLNMRPMLAVEISGLLSSIAPGTHVSTATIHAACSGMTVNNPCTDRRWVSRHTSSLGNSYLLVDAGIREAREIAAALDKGDLEWPNLLIEPALVKEPAR